MVTSPNWAGNDRRTVAPLKAVFEMPQHFQYGGGLAAAEVVCPKFLVVAGRRIIDGADNALDDVVHVGEIALQRAARVELDRRNRRASRP